MTGLYLEAHVTIAPVFDTDREQAKAIAEKHGFKLAHLVMLKTRAGEAEPSQRDTFMTSHDQNISDLYNRMHAVCLELVGKGFKVWRYKIENCVIDSRQQADTWRILDGNRPNLPLIACEGCTGGLRASMLDDQDTRL